MKRNYQGSYTNFPNVPHAASPSTYFNSTTNSRHSFPSHLASNLSPQQQSSAVVLNPNFFRNFPPPTHGQWRNPIATSTMNTGRRWPTPPNTSPQGNNARNSFSPRKKAKKKPMSQITPSKTIDINDAKKALKCETELTATKKQLVIRFPDPPLDRETVLKFNSAIKKVHFQQPSTPRFCFIQLEEGADLEKVMNELRQQKFGQGTLKVELKHELNERHDRPEDIDPYILFVGNIGQYTPAEEIKQIFHPGRVDIGPSQKIKNSRYAYVRYSQVDDAIEALKRTHGMMVGDHSINVRFRRLNGSVGLPGDSKTNKKKDMITATMTATTNTSTTASTDSFTTSSLDSFDKSLKPEASSRTSSLTEPPEISPIKQEVDEAELYEEHPEEPDDIFIKVESETFYTEHIESEDSGFPVLDAYVAQKNLQKRSERETNHFRIESENQNQNGFQQNCDNYNRQPSPLPNNAEDIHIKSEIDYESPNEEEQNEAYQFSDDLNQITAEYLASSQINTEIKTEMTDNDASSYNYSNKNSYSRRVQSMERLNENLYENDSAFIKDMTVLLKRHETHINTSN